MVRSDKKLVKSDYHLDVASGQIQTGITREQVSDAEFVHASGSFGDTKVRSLHIASNGKSALIMDDTGKITGFNLADLTVAGQMLVDSASSIVGASSKSST